MTISRIAAIDELNEMVQAAIAANATGILGYSPDVRWQGVPLASKPDTTKCWLRVSTQTVTDGQIGFGTSSSLYQGIGLLFVQLFCPRNVAQSLDNGNLLAEAIRTAFRGASISGELTFTNQSIKGPTETTEAYVLTVSVRFSYRTLATT